QSKFKNSIQKVIKAGKLILLFIFAKKIDGTFCCSFYCNRFYKRIFKNYIWKRLIRFYKYKHSFSPV
ncbi:MAG TPA: hypothetical protein PLZ46_02450, partial [Bacteroidales bacterium]|nr:hypothetical protein [Bacteroidales bacterium]